MVDVKKIFAGNFPAQGPYKLRLSKIFAKHRTKYAHISNLIRSKRFGCNVNIRQTKNNYQKMTLKNSGTLKLTFLYRLCAFFFSFLKLVNLHQIEAILYKECCLCGKVSGGKRLFLLGDTLHRCYTVHGHIN